MTPVLRFELILVLMAAVVVLDLVARRLRLPRAMALILGGIALALTPGTPDMEMDPELVLVLFLPPLLMSSAWATSWRDFRADIRIILQLAVGAVVFTTLVVGVVAHVVMPSLSWAACFALGAIVSPPDSVAAKAVLSKISAAAAGHSAAGGREPRQRRDRPRVVSDGGRGKPDRHVQSGSGDVDVRLARDRRHRDRHRLCVRLDVRDQADARQRSDHPVEFHRRVGLLHHRGKGRRLRRAVHRGLRHGARLVSA